METSRIIKIGIVTSIITILSMVFIPTPFGVPITLQTFVVAFAGFFLGKKDGVISVLIYIMLGIIGMPIFSGMKNGLSAVLGPTGGFIIGFIFLAFFSGFKKNKITNIALSIIGLIICHILGVIQFSAYTKVDLKKAFLICSAMYIVKDLISIMLAYTFANIVQKRIKK